MSTFFMGSKTEAEILEKYDHQNDGENIVEKSLSQAMKVEGAPVPILHQYYSKVDGSVLLIC